MKITSYFVWIKLNPSILVDLFVDIFSYLKENSLENIIEFQNPLSCHITLYYFSNKINENLLKDDIQSLFFDDEIKITWCKYFYREEKEFICYLFPKENENFYKLNKFFSDKFQEKKVFENSLDFVPHITLFKIKDYWRFLEHKKNIESIINNKKLIFKDNEIKLYAVNSNFVPEIQVEL